MKYKHYLVEGNIRGDHMYDEWKKKYPDIFDHFEQAEDLKHLQKLKREAYKKADHDKWPYGPVDLFWEMKKQELRNNFGLDYQYDAKKTREDKILRIRDSSGKATSRKFRR